MIGKLMGFVPTPWKIAGLGIIALAVVTAVGLGYRHYNNLLLENQTLKANNVKLEVAVEQQQQTIARAQETIDSWAEAQRQFTARVQELTAVLETASAETKRLNDVFAQHNFGELAQRKPGLIQRRVNDGTARINRLLECDTGASHPDCSN